MVSVRRVMRSISRSTVLVVSIVTAAAPASAGTIAGRVWLDPDQDGIRSAWESGASEIGVELYDRDGAQVSAGSTASDGTYEFGGLAEGNYRVRFLAPPGQGFTLEGAGPDDADSDAACATGWTLPYFVATAARVEHVDAGLLSGCLIPAEDAYLFAVTLAPGPPGARAPTLGLSNPADPSTWSGHDVYRAGTASGAFACIAENVQDEDPLRTGIQWTDAGATGSGPFFYRAVPVNASCGAEYTTAPRAADDAATVKIGRQVDVDVAANDTDEDGIALESILITAPAAHGTVTPHSDGTVAYAHNADGADTDEFRYIIADTRGRYSNHATARVSITPPDPPPDWARDAILYDILVDRFRNGDPANDPLDGTKVYEPDGCADYPHPKPIPPAGGCQHDLRAWSDPLLVPSWGLDYYGGDLKGVLDRIQGGYFDALGVNTLVLRPVFDASANHGLDVNDLHAVRAYFGSEALFDQLVSTAAAHGMRVILEGVVNHAGMDSRYLDPYGRWAALPRGACEDGDSPYRPMIESGWHGADICEGGWGWQGYWGFKTLPVWIDNASGVRDLYFRGGCAGCPGGASVSQSWQGRGVAGWQFADAHARTHDFYQEMRPYVKGSNAVGTRYGSADTLLLGELTSDCYPELLRSHLNADELDSAANYCFRDWAKDFANGGAPSEFEARQLYLRQQITPTKWQVLVNVLDSPNAPRMLGLVEGNKARLRLVALLQFTLPGVPSIYYGDEVGVNGGSDPDNRRPFPWPDINGGSNGNGDVYDSALLVTFQILGTLRRDHAPLRRGRFETLLVDDSGHLYAYLRATDTESLVVVLNNDPAGIAHEAIIPVGGRFPDGTRFGDLLDPAFSAEVSGGLLPVGVVPGTWGRVLQPLAP